MTDRETHLHKWAGLSPDAVRGLAERRTRLLVTDNLSIGVPDPCDAQRVLLIENGTYVPKSLTLESLVEDQRFTSTVVVRPLKINGGEASLVRSVAIA